ncbi:hypothetical protein B0O80DRAFT_516262 [Mortierella sp. GBAus27b]|nr:hypothetical protein B0O80DRAFT_516262 [Mortierella sp. GBAus27b]
MKDHDDQFSALFSSPLLILGGREKYVVLHFQGRIYKTLQLVLTTYLPSAHFSILKQTHDAHSKLPPFKANIMRLTALLSLVALALGAASATPDGPYPSSQTPDGSLSAQSYGDEHSKCASCPGGWHGHRRYYRKPYCSSWPCGSCGGGLKLKRRSRHDDKNSGDENETSKAKIRDMKRDDHDEETDDENQVSKAQVQGLSDVNADWDQGHALYHHPCHAPHPPKWCHDHDALGNSAPWDSNVQDDLDEGEHSLYPGWPWGRPWGWGWPWGGRPWGWGGRPWGWGGRPWGWGARH